MINAIDPLHYRYDFTRYSCILFNAIDVPESNNIMYHLSKELVHIHDDLEEKKRH